MPRHKGTPIERFWQKVDKTPGQGPQGTCWTWQGYRMPPYGYGVFGFEGKVVKAHRWIYEQLNGPLGDYCACHTCDYPPCVRPDHVFKGTLKDNSQDCIAKGRRAPCDGEHNGRAKLDWEKVRAIRTDKRPARIIASDYGVSKPTIDLIRQNRIWKESD